MVCIDVKQKNQQQQQKQNEKIIHKSKNKMSGWIIALIVFSIIVFVVLFIVVVVVFVYKRLTFIPSVSYSLDPVSFYDDNDLMFDGRQIFFQKNNFYYNGSLDPRSDDIKNLINKDVKEESLLEDYDSNPEKFNDVIETIKEIKDIYRNAKDDITNVKLINELDEKLKDKNTELFHLLNSKPSISSEGQAGFRCKICKRIFNPYEMLIKHHRLKHLDSIDRYLAIN